MAAPLSEATAATKDDEAIIAATGTIVDAYHELGWFEGTVVVAKAGQPIYRTAVGLADRETASPNTLATKYNLGSIMKNYTAVLVLQQAERGVIGLDDNLDSFDLGFPSETARKITVRHLLNHRSGLSNTFPSAYREDPLVFRTIDDKLALLIDAPLMFEPGAERRYSNYGYIVLGAILEKATGRPFADLLQENIFDRLGVENSIYPYREDAVDQSLRYSFNYDGEKLFVGVTEHHSPDGGIEATATDVLTFYRALFYGDELLSSQSSTLREYFPVDGEKWVAFGGGAGVSTAVELDLENDYQIVVLSNTDGLVAEEISGRIYSYIQSGSYGPIMLPPVVFTWNEYSDLGAEDFASEFPARYEAADYSQFIGRPLNDLGMSLVSDAKWDDAFNIFGTLRELFPNAPQVHDSLAFAHYRAGDIEKARETFATALELQPGFASDYSSDNYGHSIQ
ncbi:serine hydrolase domain-containing protein [Altererythrobacter lutimaris]|uniref:Serine hydrolase n=1 Tax=Altererythrobacter lutimaris TaxID=2743979 RepID=A0A850H9Y8_9SPHN|nr:serine hydrolase domain-containing protein [Altererythrobacter lutimaris]NVE94753.1 serine hydrolase [Altererythrobacter lutimaris]